MTGHAWTVSSIAIRPRIPHTPLLLASGTAGTLHKAPRFSGPIGFSDARLEYR
jgi:hypothetical protein